MEICKHNEFCGGCIHQGISYAAQVTAKGKEVLRLLKDKGVEYDKYLGIEGSPKQYRYRNKMEYTFGDMVKDGEIMLGMHQKGRFMNIVTVDECQLVDEDFNTILSATLQFCREKGYKLYHKKSHQGFLRHLIIRKGERTGELLVNIVTSSQAQLDEASYAGRLLSLPLENKIVGILHTFNDNLADFVHCEKLETIWGRDYYMETIMNLNFKVSAFSFFQTNVEAVEKLYSEALSLIDDFDEKTVFDLYCGTGTITQTLALRCKKAIGIEIVPEAVKAAKENATLNHLGNCEFIAGDVFEVLDAVTEKPDIIVLDPPRIGIHPKALPKIMAYGVKQILYISCNPKTLAMNLAEMQEYGYQVKTLKAYDNFPMTKHCECIVELYRK